MVSSVCPSATVSAASSRAARVRRRSSHSSMSSGSWVSPSRLHSASRVCDSRESRAKWTARSSSGWRVRAYWRARAVAMSNRSTSTITVWRLSTGASAASAAPSSSCCSSSTYCLCSLISPQNIERPDQHHHPCPLLELHRGEDEDDEGGEDGREAVDGHASAPVLAPAVEVVLDHAGAGHGEAGEHPDGVEGDQAGHLCPGGQDQRQGHHGEHDDPVGEGQAVATSGELFGEVGVLGHEAGQEGEAVEAGVSAGVEDEHGGELDHVEEELADRAGTQDVADLLGDHGGRAGRVGHGVGPVGDEGDPEHQKGEDAAMTTRVGGRSGRSARGRRPRRWRWPRDR